SVAYRSTRPSQARWSPFAARVTRSAIGWSVLMVRARPAELPATGGPNGPGPPRSRRAQGFDGPVEPMAARAPDPGAFQWPVGRSDRVPRLHLGGKPAPNGTVSAQECRAVNQHRSVHGRLLGAKGALT